MAVMVTEEQLAELSALGQAIYQGIQEQLESQHDNQFVAVHVDRGDYAIGNTSAIATRSLYKEHPLDGRAYVRKIGSEPEYGLAARLFAGEMMTGKAGVGNNSGRSWSNCTRPARTDSLPLTPPRDFRYNRAAFPLFLKHRSRIPKREVLPHYGSKPRRASQRYCKRECERDRTYAETWAEDSQTTRNAA